MPQDTLPGTPSQNTGQACTRCLSNFTPREKQYCPLCKTDVRAKLHAAGFEDVNASDRKVDKKKIGLSARKALDHVQANHNNDGSSKGQRSCITIKGLDTCGCGVLE
ncbi:hypothetical protein SELMODRAFT_428835 [Selaginella moellendorffii]|uniref:Uncharacterized protein n=1 Tax=Selaginella moellendorffii TaxID=88036 RepID=D8T459_SELML|nr:hypothetical protein SELMODRAFT_428835 [Selaginella moellendorffii]